MKKFLLVLFLLVLLVVGAAYAVLRFWPDTKAGEYAAIGRDTAVEWYGAAVDFCTEWWRGVRPAEAEKPVEKPAPAVDEPAVEHPSAAKPAPSAAPERPWKGLEPENWYCGKKLSEKSLAGKIVMVYVFSEADEDSLALLPRIEQVWSAYRSKPFVMLGSHRGGKTAKAASLIRKSKVSFPVYEDAGRTKEPGAGGRYPIVYVVDDTGRMIYRGRSDLEATEAVVTAIPDVGKKR